MGDLDVNLIREFESRPAFYDRNDMYYKDKIYCENGWEEISNALGYDVSLLKDRMLQLRNRYNLEKRRLEQLSLENPHKQMTSPWPLYNHLSFLSNHIRSRRSYKSMMTRSNPMEMMMYSNSNSNQGSPGMDMLGGMDHHYAPEHFESFEDIQIKHEKMEDCDKSNSEQPVQNTSSKGGETDNRPMPHLQHHSTNVFREPPLKRSFPVQQTPKYYGPPAPKRQKFEGRSEKFEAFGKFLSTSLCDLPESKALELVQKFTNDLVKAFLAPTEKTVEKKIPMVTIQNANSDNATIKTNGHQNGVEESSEDDIEDEEDIEEDDVLIV
ncbi:hypothetical protein ACFFRR_000670 [Megaselia abdita]